MIVADDSSSSLVDPAVKLAVSPLETLSPKVIELREKIHDSTYLNNAIDRIANVLSKRLVEDSEELELALIKDG